MMIKYRIIDKGYIQLAIRSGYYKTITVLPIKQGEYRSWNPLTEEADISIIEDETERDALPTVGYFASFQYLNGFTKSMYWSKKKMLSHADKYSPAFSAQALLDIEDGKIAERDMWKYSSFWYKDFDGMACKTMLRQLISKWGIMSVDMQQAYEADGGTIAENGQVVFDTPDPEQTIQPTQSPVEKNKTEVVETVPVSESDLPKQESFPDFVDFDSLLQ